MGIRSYTGKRKKSRSSRSGPKIVKTKSISSLPPVTGSNIKIESNQKKRGRSTTPGVRIVQQMTLTRKEYGELFEEKSERAKTMDWKHTANKTVSGDKVIIPHKSKFLTEKERKEFVKRKSANMDWEGIDTARLKKVDYTSKSTKQLVNEIKELDVNFDDNLARRERYALQKQDTSAVDDEISFLTTSKKNAIDEINRRNAINPLSYREQSKGKMGPYMISEGGHGPAIQKIAEEWNDYKIFFIMNNRAILYKDGKVYTNTFSSSKKKSSLNLKNDDIAVKLFDSYYLFELV